MVATDTQVSNLDQGFLPHSAVAQATGYRPHVLSPIDQE
jgi:hypothetical protein